MSRLACLRYPWGARQAPKKPKAQKTKTRTKKTQRRTKEQVAKAGEGTEKKNKIRKRNYRWLIAAHVRMRQRGILRLVQVSTRSTQHSAPIDLGL